MHTATTGSADCCPLSFAHTRSPDCAHDEIAYAEVNLNLNCKINLTDSLCEDSFLSKHNSTYEAPYLNVASHISAVYWSQTAIYS